MAKVIEKSAFYPYPPDVVWEAITNPAAIAEWMVPNDFKAEVGHEFTFQIDPGKMCPTYKSDGRVLEVEEPRLLRYSLVDYPKKGPPRAPQTMTWTLTPEGEGTRLRLRHEGLEAVPFWERFMLRFGWGGILRMSFPRILKHVEGEAGARSYRPGAIPPEKRPYKAETVPEHLVR